MIEDSRIEIDHTAGIGLVEHQMEKNSVWII